MFKKYNKNYKIMSTLFSFAILGFFVGTFHIVPTIHHTNDAHSHQTTKDNITCFSHELSLSNQKNDGLDLLNISMPQASYPCLFVFKEIAVKKYENILVYRSPDDKPLYIVNNTFLI